MSLLRRTGNNRNNIDWYNASSNSSGKYLRRTGTARNNVAWLQISSSGTWNLLNRTGTSRNSISWKNTTFSFIGDLTIVDKYNSFYEMNFGTSVARTNWLYGDKENGENILDIGMVNIISSTEIYHTSWTRAPINISYNQVSDLGVHQFGFLYSTYENAEIGCKEMCKFNKISKCYDDDPDYIYNGNITGKYKIVTNGRGYYYGAIQVDRGSGYNTSKYSFLKFS